MKCEALLEVIHEWSLLADRSVDLYLQLQRLEKAKRQNEKAMQFLAEKIKTVGDEYFARMIPRGGRSNEI